jgi:hypothetical protein
LPQGSGRDSDYSTPRIRNEAGTVRSGCITVPYTVVTQVFPPDAE